MHEMLENEEKNLREGGMDKKWSEDMLVRNMRSSDMLMRAHERGPRRHHCHYNIEEMIGSV